MRVLIFGDSITQGFFDSHGGWANRIAAEYHMQSLQEPGTNLQVFNLGISGDTLPTLLARFEDEAKTRLPQDKLVFVFAIGINDAVLINNRAQTDVYDFENDLEKLVKNAQKLTKNILFVGLTAVDESLTDPYPASSTGMQYLSNRVDLFEDTIKQVAERHELPIALIFDHMTMLLEKGAALLSDGLHPNDKGHELIYRLVKPELDKLIEQ